MSNPLLEPGTGARSQSTAETAGQPTLTPGAQAGETLPSDRRRKVKDLAAIVQAVATTIALFAGAWWFYAQRETFPRATISHSITHRSLTADLTLVRAAIRFTNIGKRKIDLHSGIVWLQKILPLEDHFKRQLENGKSLVASGQTAVEWPRLGEGYTPVLDISLEPGEDEDLICDFVVPATVRTVELYSFFDRLETPRIGWAKSSLYDIGAHERQEAR